MQGCLGTFACQPAQEHLPSPNLPPSSPSLQEPAPPPPKARAGALPPEDSEGPLVKLAEALPLPALFITGALDARCPPARLGQVFAQAGPAAAMDARAVVLPGLDGRLGCAAPCAGTASPSKAATACARQCTAPIAEFLEALQRGADNGEAATLRDCALPPVTAVQQVAGQAAAPGATAALPAGL